MKYLVELNEFCQQNGYLCEWSSKMGHVQGEEKWQVDLKITDKRGWLMYAKHHLTKSEARSLELCCLEVLKQSRGLAEANANWREKVAPYDQQLDVVDCIFKV